MNDENEFGRGAGYGCGCQGHGKHMHGMNHRFYEDNSNDVLGPLHKEKLVEKLKLYKEDLEAQVNFITKRINDLESGNANSNKNAE